jgi:hypothetical protein
MRPAVLRLLFLLLAGTFLLTGLEACKKQDAGGLANDQVLARVFDRELKLSEVSGIVPVGASRNDSLRILRNHVESWVRRQIVLRKADENLSDDLKDVSDELESYRQSLITYRYEEELVRQQLDTLISETEIETYYREHAENFELKENIVRTRYFRIPDQSPKLNQVRNWFQSGQPGDLQQLEKYCYQFATDYYFNTEDWMYFDDLIKKVPIRTYDKEQFLRNNRRIEIKDSSSMVFVEIVDFEIREGKAPLDLVRSQVRSLILNNRKKQLIAEMEKSAYDEAFRQDKVKIYIKGR